MYHDHILTPRGYVHRECVRTPDDCRPMNKKLLQPHDMKQLAPTNPAGWVESATFAPSVPLGGMCVTFTVPEYPSKSGALLYLFPGMQGPRNHSILQPVLQYGNNNDFGSEHKWSIASWFCSDDAGVLRSCDHWFVEPGERIVGTIESVENEDDADLMDWTVTTAVKGDPARTASLTVQRLPILFLFAIGGALEAYAPDTRRPLRATRADLPFFPGGGSTTFECIELQDIDGNSFVANWHARHPQQGDCSFEVEISDDRKSVTLNY